MKYLHVKKLLRARTLIINRSILSNRTVTGIVCGCYIRECYKPGFLKLDPGTLVTRRKVTHLTRISGLTRPCCNAGVYVYT